MIRMITLLTLLFVLTDAGLAAQRVLLLERARSSQARKIVEGDQLTFRLKGDKSWQSGFITELRPDIQAIVMNERFVMIEDIDALRTAGTPFLSNFGLSMIAFGVGWNVFALIGYPTDGDPTTNYSSFDTIVGATAVAGGFALHRLFVRKKIKMNGRNRLRIVDLNF